MQLPVMPPVAPMLAAAAPTVPPGASYEPKWDGFRCIVFRDGDEVVLGSRNEKPLTRYFPELVAAVRAELPQRCVVDGEIVVAGADGRLDFDALSQRVHPAASRVELLARTTPAAFVAFDLLALGEDDLTGRPFAQRRAALVEALAPGAPDGRVHVTPATTDADLAQRWFTEFEAAGLDGIVAKRLDAPYSPGQRVMTKVKHARTADCVVAGFRWHKTSTPEQPLVGSLLLGLHAGERLQHVGVAGSFSTRRRAELVGELAPLRLLEGEAHPWAEWSDPSAHGDQRLPGAPSRWNAAKDLSFVPLRPERVVEVRYEHLQGDRFRHLAHFVRWRDDREARSCTYEQLEQPVAASLGDVVPDLQR